MTNEERKVFELALQFIESNADSDSERELVATIKEALAQPDQDEVDIRSRLYQRIHELETQLAQPEQEPVAQCTESDSWNCKYCRKTESCKALQDPRNFASPPQRKPLTDEQILTVARDHYNPHQRPEISFARAIETAHNIKE